MLAALAPLVSCGTTGPATSKAKGEEGPLFVVPQRWEIVDEREGETLYQANLRNNEGAGRMLIGRLKLPAEVPDAGSYLYKLHNQLVDRIRGEVELAPFAEERLAWANGTVGYRTKMRGELGQEVVIIEGITVSDGKSAYFHYGLFPEDVYQTGSVAYQQVLASLGPLKGAQRVRSGLDISGAAGAESQDVGSDGARTPDDYQSPATHLGLASWGITRTDVTKAAGPPLREGQSAIGYRCQLLGADDCVVVYIFEFGQLTHGGFLLEKELAPKDHVARYLRTTKQLSERFGRPTQSAAIWANPRYKNDGSKWGDALAGGEVIFGTVWKIGPTRVVHSLRKNDEGRVEHRVLMSNDELRASLQNPGAQPPRAAK